MAEKRAQQVMLAMCDAGFITVRQMKSAQKPTRSLQLVKQSSLVGRYFVDWILEQIPSLIGPIVEDLVVTTTLDLSMQKLAEKEVSQMIDREGSRLNCSQAALLSMTPSGAIRAMVGGKHYYSSQFNRAVQALRPTGSTFKYFIYLAALERGLIPETRVVDTPLQIAQWKPKNYKWESQGQVSMQDGFAYSVNTVSARIARYIGLKHIHNLVHRFGITTRLPNDLTISLGSVDATLLEMTAAYGVMPNEGYAVHPFGIIEIRNSRGKVLYRPPVRNYQRLVSQQNLESMRQLMSAVMQYGTGHHASLQCECWGKSGTTQNQRDAWFIGFTPTLVTGVWTGNDDNQPMKNVTGGKLPGKIWCQFMRNAVDR
jgi:penicillin-binding protein 1A